MIGGAPCRPDWAERARKGLHGYGHLCNQAWPRRKHVPGNRAHQAVPSGMGDISLSWLSTPAPKKVKADPLNFPRRKRMWQRTKDVEARRQRHPVDRDWPPGRVVAPGPGTVARRQTHHDDNDVSQHQADVPARSSACCPGRTSSFSKSSTRRSGGKASSARPSQFPDITVYQTQAPVHHPGRTATVVSQVGRLARGIHYTKDNGPLNLKTPLAVSSGEVDDV